jgi:hypothetical protein
MPGSLARGGRRRVDILHTIPLWNTVYLNHTLDG